jgi:hypothetical protein
MSVLWVACAPDDGWKYHPKHVEQFPDINKVCNVVSCWIYEYIEILLGAQPILHISRIRVKQQMNETRSPLADIKNKQLQWYGRVQRMEGGRLPKEVIKWRPPGRRKRGRPNLT